MVDERGVRCGLRVQVAFAIHEDRASLVMFLSRGRPTGFFLSPLGHGMLSVVPTQGSPEKHDIMCTRTSMHSASELPYSTLASAVSRGALVFDLLRRVRTTQACRARIGDGACGSHGVF